MAHLTQRLCVLLCNLDIDTCYYDDSPWSQRLQLKKLKLLSNCAYNVDLRRYSMGHRPSGKVCPEGLLSSNPSVNEVTCPTIDAVSTVEHPTMLGAMATFVTEKLKLAYTAIMTPPGRGRAAQVDPDLTPD